LESGWRKRACAALAVLVFLLLLGRSARQASRAPVLNWDLVPAMALALEWTEDDAREVHRRTYEAVQDELGPAAFAELTAPGVRAARFQDPDAFHEHLPFYRARVLYTLGIAALHGLGAPLSAATWWIAVGAYGLLALVLLAWSTRHVGLALAALFALGLAHTPALLTQARFSSADGLATLLIVAGAYLFVERRAFVAGALVLTLSLGARPDGIVLIGFLALALPLFLPRDERPSLRALCIWVLASAAVYLALTRFAGEYGWWPLITISFEEKAVHPAQLSTSFDASRYLEILGRQLGALPGDGYVTTGREVTGSTLVFVYAGVAVLGLALWSRARDIGGRAAALLAALCLAYLVRYLLFPQLWDRFFAPFYALVPLLVLSLVSERLVRPGTTAPVTS